MSQTRSTPRAHRGLRLALVAPLAAFAVACGNVSGQKLSIEAVPDGRYALRSVADPENRFAESDPDNNGATVYLRINGDEVEEIDEK